jgi:hypothetical protein
METSKQSTGETLFDLTSYVGGTPASHSALRANEKAKKTRDTCGRGYEKPLANYDPDTQSWKMCVDILALVEPPLLETLPPSGMTRSGVLYPQPAWEPITDATESLSWPTPTAVEWKGRGPNSKQQGLAEMAKKHPWPTMSANGMGNTGSRAMLDKHIAAGSITEADKRAMSAGNGGKLNPTWVEWLMGFPPGWTDLKD